MPRDYWHCPVCNGNFDYGEKCDCEQNNEHHAKLKVSETFIIGVDISENDDTSAVSVARLVDGRCKIINTLYGQEAEKIYSTLINEGGVSRIPTEEVENGSER